MQCNTLHCTQESAALSTIIGIGCREGKQDTHVRLGTNPSRRFSEIFSFFLHLSFSLFLKSLVHSSLFRCSVWKIGVSEYRGSAAGFLIAAERKSRLERRRLTVPGIEPVNHRLYMGRCLQTARCQSHVNCWQHSFLGASPARIIHIFTGSQINSPRAHPEARILKPGTSFGQLEFKQNHVHLQPIWCSGWPAPQKPRAIKLPFIYALVRPLNPIYSSVRPNQRSQKGALVNNWAAACSKSKSAKHSSAPRIV